MTSVCFLPAENESLALGAYYLAAAETLGQAGRATVSALLPRDDITDEEAQRGTSVGRSCRAAKRRYGGRGRAAGPGGSRRSLRRAAEFGARALGNRSILADPGNADLPRVLKPLVKRRDSGCPSRRPCSRVGRITTLTTRNTGAART